MVLVAEKLGKVGLELLRDVTDVDCSYNLSLEEISSKVAHCDALILRSGTKVGRDVFESAGGRLKVVVRDGVGIDKKLDLFCRKESIFLAVVQAVLIAFTVHLNPGKWERNNYVGVSLPVMGFGEVGSEVARRAKGLGMHVIAHDPYAAADHGRARGVGLVTFDEAIASADFILLHMPLTPSTSKILNDEAFSKMKKGVWIVNVAHGGMIDEDALVRALDSGIVAQDALDVFTEEPPSADNKLVPDTATPHLGASTIEAQEGVAIEIAEAVVGALKGELAATAADAPMVPAEVLSELAPFVVLAEKLGRLGVQLVAGGSGLKLVKVTYLDTRLLRAMIRKGLIEPVSSVFVNADLSAKKRGIRIIEERIYWMVQPKTS
ncbi:putative D-3-phosphoglycerate dehydrogenase 1, chloroplastic [Cocos nucifera]|uniref:phosphoglycerate dehydrogenase n=1 Tax=Cocos nucifera TaxID=13894 RepID=A0A8K0MUM2_COCNU|nr:putative D-3-phosphoglycerate dehydrogenase 1, chloroplastic [Cocos nucifera]